MAEKLAYQGHHDRILQVARKKCGTTNGYCSKGALDGTPCDKSRAFGLGTSCPQTITMVGLLLGATHQWKTKPIGSPDAFCGEVPSLGTSSLRSVHVGQHSSGQIKKHALPA